MIGDGDEREREIKELLKSGGAAPEKSEPASPPGSAHPPMKRAGGRPKPIDRPDLREKGHFDLGKSSTVEPAGEPPRGAKLPFNYGALVAVLVFFVAIFILVNALRNTESGTVGIGPVGIGEKVDPFAVPIATSDLEGDANVDPDQACRVAGAEVLRICDYFERPLLVSFWFTGGASECIDQQDIFDQVARRFKSRIGAVSINVRDDRSRVRELIAERGWKVPVGHDTDGAVSNMYRVGGCPTFLFVRPGGVLERAEIGRTTSAELTSQVRSFLNGQ